MKRSSVVTLAWMGVGVGVVVALSFGDSDTVSASAYESVDQCSASGQSRQTCETAFNDARAEHVQASPRYTKLEDCEAEFGANGCLTMTPPDSTGGGAAALFVPAMAGFLLANAANSALRPQPLYRSCTDSNDPQCRNNSSSSGSHGVYAGGGRWYYTASGDRVASASGPVSVERGVFTGHAPATTLARGGFGARASMHAAS